MVKANTKTRKNKKTKVFTVPQLRAAFERLDKKAMELKGKDKETQIKEFQHEWASVFSRTVSPEAIESYLAVKHAEKGKKRNTRNKRNSMRGGAAPLMGAPVADFQTRPGIDGPYGNFPEYLTGGLTFYDNINQQARMADCGVKDFSPKLLPGMGSNQAGGALAALVYKPVDNTVPPNLIQTVRANMLGMPAPYKPL
jgi:hypothetical protein